MNQKLYNCVFIKSILMLLVILYHSTVFWNGNWFTVEPVAFQSTILGVFSQWLNSFHIYAFILVSGYIFAFKMSGGGGYPSYIEFLKNKAKRLLLPYAFVAVVWVIPISQFFNHSSAGDILKQYVLCINPSQLWFLWMLFWIFTLAWPLWKWLSSSFVKCILVSLAFYVIGLIGGQIIPNIFCFWTALRSVPFFCMGIQIWMQQKNVSKLRNQNNECETRLWVERVPSIYWILLDFLFFYIYLSSKRGYIPIPGMTIISGFALNIVGAVMSFLVLQKMAEIAKWKNSKVFTKLSEFSMPMYLFHQQIIYFTITIFNGRVNPCLNACFNFLIATVLSMLFSVVLMKFKITRMLVGGR